MMLTPTVIALIIIGACLIMFILMAITWTVSHEVTKGEFMRKIDANEKSWVETTNVLTHERNVYRARTIAAEQQVIRLEAELKKAQEDANGKVVRGPGGRFMSLKDRPINLPEKRRKPKPPSVRTQHQAAALPDTVVTSTYHSDSERVLSSSSCNSSSSSSDSGSSCSGGSCD